MNNSSIGPVITPTSVAEDRLRGNMGVGELVMSVLAFSSPLTTVAGFIPVLLIFSGHTAPGIYLLLTLMLLIFAVGFVKMSADLKNPGGFYSFITVSLGKPAGLGGAILALFGYLVLGFFAPALFAATIQPFVVSFGGPEIAWYWYALSITIVTTTLAYRKIDLSAKVLSIVMGLEIVVVLIFNIAAFSNGRGSTESIAFALPTVGDAGLGLALLFAVGNFFGFEATVIYRDEVKNPDKTIPRATYTAIIGIGVFYALAAWAYIAFFGADSARSAAEANTSALFNDALAGMVGKTFSDIATLLLITSVLASMLSIQNIASRYGFTLAQDRALPAIFGRVHPTQKSPYMSAASVGILWGAGVVVFSVIGASPVVIYTVAAGSGGFALLLLITVASLSVFVYFQRQRARNPQSVWKTVVAPLVSFVFLAVIVFMACTNYPELIGGSITVTVVFMTTTAMTVLGGIGYALYLRKRRPDCYARLGRKTPEACEVQLSDAIH